jgi:hypothetical protein
MEPGTITALTTSSAALASAVFAALFGVVKWRDERHARLQAAEEQRIEWEDQRVKWEQTFEDAREGGVADWRVQFLRDLVLQRVATYADVLKALGAVRDVQGDGEHLEELARNPGELLKTADELLGHLYGPAGLVMSMTTRGWVHRARLKCLEFQSGDNKTEGLVNAFFYARRHLRQDIQIADSASVATALSELGEERLAKPGSK